LKSDLIVCTAAAVLSFAVSASTVFLSLRVCIYPFICFLGFFFFPKVNFLLRLLFLLYKITGCFNFCDCAKRSYWKCIHWSW